MIQLRRLRSTRICNSSRVYLSTEVCFNSYWYWTFSEGCFKLVSIILLDVIIWWNMDNFLWAVITTLCIKVLAFLTLNIQKLGPLGHHYILGFHMILSNLLIATLKNSKDSLSSKSEHPRLSQLLRTPNKTHKLSDL